MIEVTFYLKTETVTSRHKTDDPHEALERATKKRWGKNAHFHIEHGTSPRNPFERRSYGQVCEPIKNNPGCSNCITDRIGVDVKSV